MNGTIDGKKSVRVMIVDDHAMMCDGIRGGLERNGYEVCESFTNAADLLNGLKTAAPKPDILLLDIGIPIQPGTVINQCVESTVKGIEQIAPQTTIIFLSSDLYDDWIDKVCDGSLAWDGGGVRGYWSKFDVNTETLKRLLGRLSLGEVSLSETVVAQKEKQTEMRSLLSKRQMEIFTLLGRYPELSAQESADQLCIAIQTYRNNVSGACQALGVPNKTAALTELLKYNVVRLPLTAPFK